MRPAGTGNASNPEISCGPWGVLFLRGGGGGGEGGGGGGGRGGRGGVRGGEGGWPVSAKGGVEGRLDALKRVAYRSRTALCPNRVAEKELILSYYTEETLNLKPKTCYLLHLPIMVI